MSRKRKNARPVCEGLEPRLLMSGGWGAEAPLAEVAGEVLAAPQVSVDAQQSFSLTSTNTVSSPTYAIGDIIDIGHYVQNAPSGSTMSLCYDEDATWMNGNEHWMVIDTAVSNGEGSYQWNTSGVAPGTYYLAGYMYDWNGTYSISQLGQAIMIEGGGFDMLSPDASVATAGESVRLRWSASALPSGSTVSLCYDEDTTQLNGNEHWIAMDRPISSGLGSFLWDTTGVSSGTYYLGGYTYDWNGTFTFTPLSQSIAVTGGQSFELTGPIDQVATAGETVLIEWNAGGIVPGATISLCYDADTTWFNGNEEWVAIDTYVANGQGTYAWDTSDVAAGDYYISGYVYDWMGTFSVSQLTSAVHVQVDGGGDPSDPTPGGAVTGSILDGAGGLELLVLGTVGSDDILLSQTGSGITMMASGFSQSFTGSFASVVVYGFDGADSIRLDNTVFASGFVYAGDGDDMVYESGSGSATLNGGAGDDRIVSIGGGSDTVYGNDGLDSTWLDANDFLVDLSSDEAVIGANHRIQSFYQPYGDVVSMEIAGQDFEDPSLTNTSYVYKDYSGNPLFVGTPEMDDINQGSVGDCYWLAGLGSLAMTDPELIEQSVTELGDGTYAVRFYDNSYNEVYLRLDGDLAVRGSWSTSLSYAKQGNDGEIWAPVLEKAYAYYRYGENSYASLSGGWMSEAYRHVGGSSYSTYSLGYRSEQNIWDTFEQHLDAGHAITLGSKSSPATPIVGGHAYVVESISQTSEGTFVTVFNPWGYDGRTWDSNYNDGLLTISVTQLKASFTTALICLA